MTGKKPAASFSLQIPVKSWFFPKKEICPGPGYA